MGSEAKETIDIINKLNEELYAEHGETELCFWLKANGYVEAIYFDEMHLWDSEGDGREFDENDEQEPLIGYVRRVFQQQANKMARYANHAELAAAQAENARKDALIEALEGMVNSARNFNGDKWGVRRYTEIPSEGPHELEGKWYGWKDDWNGGVDGPHNTALEAFEALTDAARTGRDGE